MEAHGISFTTCRDRVTGLIACPICIHASSKCLGGKPPAGDYRFENSFFYTLDDLIQHLKAYHLRGWHKRIEKIASMDSMEE
ncbi:MAG: hypothetical protein OWQ48_05350 [Desulfurococcus sp.]|nr:hypothetical protein [Desulfurococcus sp.]